jgi:VWFA-related protein
MRSLTAAWAVLALGAAPPGYQDQVDVRVVLVDVTVTDRQGAFVEGLDVEDFRVFDNGRPCAIQSVTPIHHRPVMVQAPTQPAQTATTKPAPPVPPPPKAVPPRHFVFLYDFSGLTTRPFGIWRAGEDAAAWCRQNLQPEDRLSLAVFHNTLRFVVEDQPPVEGLCELLEQTARNVPDSPFDASILQDPWMELEPQQSRALDEIEESRAAFHADRLVRALETLAVRLEQRPGRKAVFLLSAGHSMANLLPGPDSNAARSAALRIFREQLAQRFQAADAAIYSLHTGGLQPTGDTAEVRRMGFGDPEGFSELRSRDITTLWAEQDMLAFLSHQTGGAAIRNTNDYLNGLEHMASQLDSYYQLSFAVPVGEPGAFHELDIDVLRDDVKVRHKAGYYAPTPYKDMDTAERKRAVVAAVGAGDTLAEFPAALMLVSEPAGPDEVHLDLVARVPGSVLAEIAEAGSTLRVIMEARDALGRGLASLHEVLRLDQVASVEGLREHPLDYVGGMIVPRIEGSLRVVLHDDASGRTVRASLPYDLRPPVQPPVLVESDSRPLRITRREAGGDDVEGRTLMFKSRQLHPVMNRQVRSGQEIELLLQLPGASDSSPARLNLALRDVSGSRYPLNALKVQRELREGHITTLVRVGLPTLASGACAIELLGRIGDQPFATHMPMQCN